MKYLILGSSGQIGSYLVKYCIDNQLEYDTIDIVSGENEDLRHINDNIERKFHSCDFIFFLAFDVGGSEYLKKYEKEYSFLDNNILIMQNVFALLKKYNKPFIFALSQMSNMSYSPYGVLKRIGEFYTNSLNGIFVKFWNVYGKETDSDKFHVITDFINKAKYGILNLITDGEEERQFLHVDDCCRALIILSNNYNNLNRSNKYDITSFVWTKIIDIATIISTAIPCTIIRGTCADILQQHIKNDPDNHILQYWHPKIDIVTGINKIIKEHNE